ncbi:unnamed protein product [Spirodela intermedia]|uniref:Uncharacterized protein n=1 Tax=Spirodela intermedia TaxID=51605 RepID=A0ABN7E8T6_SPIIN|nr:unnamed protein product [Spirodela intermedia]
MVRALLDAYGSAAHGGGGSTYKVPGTLLLFCMVVASLSIIPTILFACGHSERKKREKEMKEMKKREKEMKKMKKTKKKSRADESDYGAGSWCSCCDGGGGEGGGGGCCGGGG